MRRISIIFLFCLAAGAAAAAEQPPVSVSSAVDKSKITIGDLIRYTVTVAHDTSVRVEMPGAGANLGGFEIRGYQVDEPKTRKGRVVSSAEYVLSTFLTGEYVIPPLTIGYAAGGDSIPRVLSTDKIKITVESVKPSEAGDIKDIKPPLEIPREWWRLARNAGLFILALGLALAGAVVVRRWKEGKSLVPVRAEPPRPPHEIALEALGLLSDSDLLEKGETKRFYTELSEIIRRYIEGRWFVPAMEMTTTEVLDNLSSAPVSKDDFSLFPPFFGACDLVKFAKHVPMKTEHDAALRAAYDIVHKTKIVIEEPVQIEAGDKVSEN